MLASVSRVRRPRRIQMPIHSELGDLPIVPHQFVDDVDCCGCLVVEVRGDQAKIFCNECLGVIRTLWTW
jgi:hypothetical protein